MSRLNVKHTPLPADDLEELAFEPADHSRRRPMSMQPQTNDILADEQYSECDESGSHSRNSTDLNGSAEPVDACQRTNVKLSDASSQRAFGARGQSAQNRMSARATKRPRKRTAKEGPAANVVDANANNFRQLHTLNFLPPPPPRDTPPITNPDAQSLAAANMTLARSSASRQSNGTLWTGTLHSSNNQSLSAANYHQYASATLLNAPAENNMYYLSSAIGYLTPSSVQFGNGQHAPLLQPSYLKNANFANSQCNLPQSMGAMHGQLIMDDNANATLLTGQPAAYASSNGSGSAAQYETLQRMNANRQLLQTVNSAKRLNGTDSLRQPLAPNVAQQDMSDAARVFLDYSNKYGVKFADDQTKRSTFCSWKTAAIVAVIMCLLLVPFIIYFCVVVSKAESGVDASSFDAASVNFQADGVPVRVQLKPFRMWYTQVSAVAASSGFVGDSQSRRLLKLRVVVREPDSYYRLAVFFQHNYRPTALRYEDRYIVAKDEVYDANNGTKMLVTVNSKQRRETDVSMYKSFTEAGTWFIGLYVDSAASFGVSLSLEYVSVNSSADGSNECRALRNCNGAGWCIDGACACLPGFTGDTCEPRSCPVLCNARGFYYKGACQCFPPFSGPECDVRLDDPCSNVKCNNHGTCKNGQCACELPYSGPTCSEITCKPHNCNGNGHCSAGTCRCYHGWTGEDCGQPLAFAVTADPATSCGKKGVYDPVNRQCACNSGYTGVNCENKLCSLPCVNGLCVNGHCACDPGWSGRLCDIKECSALCAEHGRCMNGTCVCAERYYGMHCNHEMCPNNCNNFGVCARNGTGYSCRCAEGRAGDACQYAAEICDDNADNDGDSLVDCADPDCCSTQRCQAADTAMMTCTGVLAPEDAVLVRTKPARFPTFFDNTKAFFADEYSSSAVQQYAKAYAFLPAMVSIVYGYVTLRGNDGVYGCRVSVADRLSEYGYVHSRTKGRFDMVVNGGQFITFLISCRDDRLVRYVTAYVSANTFVRLPNIEFDERDIARTNSVLGRISQAASVELANLQARERTRVCSRFPHNALKNRPRIFVQSNVPAYSNRAGADCISESAALSVTRLIPERRAILDSIRIPETNFHLVWSNTQNKYGLLVIIQLTPASMAQMDASLNVVHLTINFAGNDAKAIRHRFVARANLTFTYLWSRRDSYGQSRYGLTAAYVSAGYEYISCPGRVFWEHQTLTLPSDILLPVAYGGWSIDAIHEYNPVDSVLIRGDSSAVYYRMLPKLVRTMMGSKALRPRPTECPMGGASCHTLVNTEASKVQLHTVLQLLPDSYGNIWILDHNLIRYVQVNTTSLRANVRSVYEMPAYAQLKVAPETYHIALSVADAQLYVSDPLQKLIFRLNLNETIYWRQTAENQKRPSWKSPSMEVIAGTGEQCQPAFTCGDSANAHTPLYEPKSIALDKYGNVYFIDGFLLRRVKPSTREIETVIGNAQLPSGASDGRSKEALCVGDVVPFSELDLLWPSAMRFSTFEDVIYLVSHNHVLLRLYLADAVALVVGSNCAKSREDSVQLLTTFTSIVDFTIHDNGNILVLERVKERGNRIVEIRTDGSAAILMNYRDEVSGAQSAADESDTKSYLHAAVHSNLTTIGYLPNGEFLLGEIGQSVVHHVHFDLPELATFEYNGRQEQQYRIRDPSTKETYVFNSGGKHLATLHSNLLKKHQLDSGRMTEFNSNGEQMVQSRISVSDRSQTQTKSGHTVYQIETTRGREASNKRYHYFFVDQKFNLVRFESESTTVTLRYGPPDSETLLSEKSIATTSGVFNYSFIYDRNDMLTSMTVPDGQASRLVTIDLQPVRFYAENGTLSYLLTSDQQSNLRVQAPFGGLEESERDWMCSIVNVTASTWKWQRVGAAGGEHNVRVLALSNLAGDRRNRLV